MPWWESSHFIRWVGRMSRSFSIHLNGSSPGRPDPIVPRSRAGRSCKERKRQCMKARYRGEYRGMRWRSMQLVILNGKLFSCAIAAQATRSSPSRTPPRRVTTLRLQLSCGSTPPAPRWLYCHEEQYGPSRGQTASHCPRCRHRTRTLRRRGMGPDCRQCGMSGRRSCLRIRLQGRPLLGRPRPCWVANRQKICHTCIID